MKPAKQKLIETVLRFTDRCWVCKTDQNITLNHSPPRSMSPKVFVKYPLCVPCHRKLTGIEYTGRQRQILKGNINKIERAVKRVREKML